MNHFYKKWNIALYDIVIHKFNSEENLNKKPSSNNSIMKAIENFIYGLDNLKLYKYLNCNGLDII